MFIYDLMVFSSSGDAFIESKNNKDIFFKGYKYLGTLSRITYLVKKKEPINEFAKNLCRGSTNPILPYIIHITKRPCCTLFCFRPVCVLQYSLFSSRTRLLIKKLVFLVLAAHIIKLRQPSFSHQRI